MLKKLLTIFSLLACAAFAQSPSVISVSPNSGTGAAQTFSLMVTSGTGNPQDVNLVVLDITDGGGRHCNGIFDWHNHAIALYNDANSGLVNNQWMTTGTGISTGQTNSQCTLTTGGANYTLFGANLVVYFPMSFNSSFAGNKSEVTYVSNLAGSGNVQNMGSWTVPGPGGTPSILSVSPNSGTGSNQTFQVTVSAADGNPQNLPTVVLDIGDSAGHHCNANYQQLGGFIALYNDANTNIVNGQWMTAGSNATQVNSQCTLTAAGAHHTFSGSTITVYFPMSFNSSFAGVKTEVVYAADGSGHGVVQNMGSWTIPPGGGAMRKGDSTVTQNIDDTHPQYGIDALTGNSVLMPTSLHPLVSLNLWTATQDWPDSIADGQTYNVNIRHAKPNTQVWARVMLDETQPVAQMAYKPDPNGDVVLPVSANLDALEKVGWFMGYTDSTGYFQFSAKVPTSSPVGFYGLNSVQIHIGTITGGEVYTVNPYTALDDSTYIGAVNFISYDANNPPPVFTLNAQPEYSRSDQPVKRPTDKK